MIYVVVILACFMAYNMYRLDEALEELDQLLDEDQQDR